jgi:hypothetical protein
MKIFRHNNETASVMVLGLITSAVLMVGLASYISLIQAQNNAVMRSQTWNAAIPAAEAGIEDALAHLNTIGDKYRGTNGYALNEDGLFTVSRELNGLRYTVGIDRSNQPAIYATGYVHAPKGGGEISRVIRVQTTRANSGMRGLVAINGITMNGSTEADSFDSENPLYSNHGVYDPTKRKDGSFVGAVTGNVDTGGGKVYGYMATGPNGQGTGNAGDFAWLTSHSGTQPGHYQKDFNVYYPPVDEPFSGGAAFPATGATIVTTNYSYGTVMITTNVYPSPAPASGVTTRTTNYITTTYPIGKSGVTTNTTFTSSKTFPGLGTYVGNVVQRVVTSGNPSGRGTWYDYQAITGYSYPTTVYTYAQDTTTMTTTSATYEYALGTGNYQMQSLSMTGGKLIVTGDAVLYVTGDVSMTGQAQLIVAPGGSLKIYVAGSSANFGGNGILNQSGDTTKFTYFGLPGNTSLGLSGNSSFTGTFYAPNANFALNGGGNNDYDFAGASVTKTVSMHGHFKFHYDERLGRVVGPVRYRAASWNEL